MSERFTPEAQVPQEIKEGEPKIEKLTVSNFAREIGLQPNAQGRFTFGPEHDRLAYEYAEKFARDRHAEGIVIDGVASPSVIASLLHGAHPAEGYVTYVARDKEGKPLPKVEVKVLEPLPSGDGKGPEYLTWTKTETDEYTLIDFNLSRDIPPQDLAEVIPPDVDPSKPVLISGRGPLYLTHTIAAGYRHYKGIPGVGFYQPASKFGPARTEIGISHHEELPLGLNFGEPTEIGSAREKYEEQLVHNKTVLAEAMNKGRAVGEMRGKELVVKLEDGTVLRVPRLEVVE